MGGYAYHYRRHQLKSTLTPAKEKKTKREFDIISKQASQEDLTHQSFVSFTEESFKLIPTRESLKGLQNEDVHHQPVIVAEFGDRLAKIKEELKLNPKLKEAALKFYQKCAKKENGYTPIRALCLANFQSEGGEVSLKDYPESVRELSRKVLDLD